MIPPEKERAGIRARSNPVYRCLEFSGRLRLYTLPQRRQNRVILNEKGRLCGINVVISRQKRGHFAVSSEPSLNRFRGDYFWKILIPIGLLRFVWLSDPQFHTYIGGGGVGVHSIVSHQLSVFSGPGDRVPALDSSSIVCWGRVIFCNPCGGADAFGLENERRCFPPLAPSHVPKCEGHGARRIQGPSATTHHQQPAGVAWLRAMEKVETEIVSHFPTALLLRSV
jgi:hypothetical protein